MLNVNKKILWLADYNLSEAPGGAQRSDEMIISQGKLLNLNILKQTYSTLDPQLNIHDYDIVITSNIHALTIKNKNLIDEISKHKYHVRLEHDSNEYLTQEQRIKLFSSCKKTIFLSDFHYSFFKEYYGNIFKNVEIIYDPIDILHFKDHKQEREDAILYAGYLHPLKGSYDFFEYALLNPNKRFIIAGWPSNAVIEYLSKNIKNIENLGLIDHVDMPIIYNKYKYMYYTPNLNEPFCRSVAEAVLCGMQIFTKKDFGIGSLMEIDKKGIETFADECYKAAYKFWQTIL